MRVDDFPGTRQGVAMSKPSFQEVLEIAVEQSAAIVAAGSVLVLPPKHQNDDVRLRKIAWPTSEYGEPINGLDFLADASCAYGYARGAQNVAPGFSMEGVTDPREVDAATLERAIFIVAKAYQQAGIFEEARGRLTGAVNDFLGLALVRAQRAERGAVVSDAANAPAPGSEPREPKL
jgi:hypothetical protein